MGYIVADSEFVCIFELLYDELANLKFQIDLDDINKEYLQSQYLMMSNIL